MLSDALGSASAISAALLVLAFGWRWADPSRRSRSQVDRAVSWSLLREAVSVLMEWAPEHVDVEAIHRQLAGVPP